MDLHAMLAEGMTQRPAIHQRKNLIARSPYRLLDTTSQPAPIAGRGTRHPGFG
jgi:hypothetical protein